MNVPEKIRSNKEKLAKNLKILESFESLQNNWNFNGAKPFGKELVGKAIEIVKSIEIQPLVFPTGRDSIQFEYEKDNGDYLEFEIFEDSIICLQIISDKENEFPIKDILKINELVCQFYA